MIRLITDALLVWSCLMCGLLLGVLILAPIHVVCTLERVVRP